MKIKKFYLIFLLLPLLFLAYIYFSKPRYDLRNAVDCNKQIINELQDKKLIFLSENHDEVGVIYFLIENLEKFYVAGVRYIFLEDEPDLYMTEPENIKIFLFPPWLQQGKKIQYLILEEEIVKLNKKYTFDPLIVIWPETGLIFDESDWADTHKMMNKRDMQAQKTIIEIMDSTNKKGLIFYGNGHGIKKPFVWDPESSKEPYWIPCGFYLNNHYGADYCSFNIFNFDSNEHRKILYKNKNDVKILPENIVSIILEENDTEQEFDYYAGYSKSIAAVPVSYYPNYYNLKSMINKLLSMKIETDTKIDPWSDKSDLMLSIYYLKYHLGNRFNFDITKSVSDLQNALSMLNYDDLNNLTFNLSELEEYMSFLYAVSYGSSIQNIYFCMKMAQRINKKDIWPQFHICMIKQENAEESGKKSAYKKALKAWNELFNNELLFSSPVLELACQKAALCANKLNENGVVEYYNAIEKSINPIFKIDYEYYQFYGW